MTESSLYIIDSNAVLRYLLKDNLAQNREVEKMFKKTKEVGGRIFVTREVVMECVYVLMRFYKVGRQDVVVALKAFLNTNEVDVEGRELVMKTLESLLVTNISYVDCLVLEQSKQLGVKLITFDKNLLAKIK